MRSYLFTRSRIYMITLQLFNITTLLEHPCAIYNPVLEVLFYTYMCTLYTNNHKEKSKILKKR